MSKAVFLTASNVTVSKSVESDDDTDLFSSSNASRIVRWAAAVPGSLCRKGIVVGL